MRRTHMQRMYYPHEASVEHIRYSLGINGRLASRRVVQGYSQDNEIHDILYRPKTQKVRNAHI